MQEQQEGGGEGGREGGREGIFFYCVCVHALLEVILRGLACLSVNKYRSTIRRGGGRLKKARESTNTI